MSIMEVLEAIKEISESGLLSEKEIHRLNRIKNRKAKREVKE